MIHRIVCRAQVSGLCEDGHDIDPEAPPEEDGTFDPETGSIICDSCYLRVIAASPSGMGLDNEIPETVERLRQTAQQ